MLAWSCDAFHDERTHYSWKLNIWHAHIPTRRAFSHVAFEENSFTRGVLATIRPPRCALFWFRLRWVPAPGRLCWFQGAFDTHQRIMIRWCVMTAIHGMMTYMLPLILLRSWDTTQNSIRPTTMQGTNVSWTLRQFTTYSWVIRSLLSLRYTFSWNDPSSFVLCLHWITIKSSHGAIDSSPVPANYLCRGRIPMNCCITWIPMQRIPSWRTHNYCGDEKN